MALDPNLHLTFVALGITLLFFGIDSLYMFFPKFLKYSKVLVGIASFIMGALILTLALMG